MIIAVNLPTHHFKVVEINALQPVTLKSDSTTESGCVLCATD